MANDKMIGQRIREARKRSGMKQDELGTRVGIGKSSISEWESGKRSPDIDKIEDIANALNVSAAYLMGWESEPSATPLPRMEENKSFGERLREKRKENNLTQKQLAEIIGVAKSTVAGYESGHSEPDMEKIVKIMGALDVDANYLWQDAMKYKSYDDYISSDALEIAKQYDHLEPDGKQFIQMAMKFAQRPNFPPFGGSGARYKISVGTEPSAAEQMISLDSVEHEPERMNVQDTVKT